MPHHSRMPFLQAYLLAVFVACVSAHWQWQWQQQPQQQWQGPPQQQWQGPPQQQWQGPPQQQWQQRPQWHSQWQRPSQQHWLRLQQWQQPQQEQKPYASEDNQIYMECICQQKRQPQQQPQQRQNQPQQPQKQPQQEQRPYVAEVDRSCRESICQQPQQPKQKQEQPQQPPKQPQEQPQQSQQPQPKEQPQQSQQPQPKEQPQQPQEQPEQPEQQPPQEQKPHVPEVDQNCMECLCQASSSCNMTLECKSKGGDDYFCGPYWVSWAYWYDAGRYGYTGKPEDFETCLNNKECAERTVRGFMRRYGRDCDGSGTVDCADFARIHKLGFKQCDRDSILDTAYWQRFELCNKDDQSNEEIELDGRKQEV
ncbi:uncharacterized protein NPIL_563971 [Nephila pilipes]|uniref:lysozyme n=1 Tax=Nephila pilipes TaxID=299642 RepID=A0A8X6U3U4_NEPPI|nr:uncharacterized protein NPIL_563971 [Nephila pilipes]